MVSEAGTDIIFKRKLIMKPARAFGVVISVAAWICYRIKPDRVFSRVTVLVLAFIPAAGIGSGLEKTLAGDLEFIKRLIQTPNTPVQKRRK